MRGRRSWRTGSAAVFSFGRGHGDLGSDCFSETPETVGHEILVLVPMWKSISLPPESERKLFPA